MRGAFKAPEFPVGAAMENKNKAALTGFSAFRLREKRENPTSPACGRGGSVRIHFKPA